MVGPNDLEKKLNEFEKSIITFLYNQNKFIWLSLCFALMVGVVYVRKWFVTMEFKFLHYPNFSNFLEPFLLAIVLSFFLPFVEKEKKIYFTAYAFFQVLLFHVFKTNGQINLWATSLYVLIVFSSFVFLSYCSKKLSSIIVYIGYILFLLFVFISIDPEIKWILTKNIHYYITSVVILHLEVERFNGKRYLKYLLSPTHLFLPIIFPLQETLATDSREDDSVWLSGMVQLFKSFFLLSILYLLMRYYFYDQVTKSIPLKNIWGYYVGYLFLAPVVGNFVTGLAKVYYFDVPDCSDHLWLSKSPLDFLKRENVHAYKFSIRYFYFGFLRITRSPVIIVLLYMVLFPLYRDSLTYLAVKNPLTWDAFVNYYEYRYYYSTGLLTLIFLTFRLKFFSENRNSWMPVLIHHSFMMVLFILLYLPKYLN